MHNITNSPANKQNSKSCLPLIQAQYLQSNILCWLSHFVSFVLSPMIKLLIMSFFHFPKYSLIIRIDPHSFVERLKKAQLQTKKTSYHKQINMASNNTYPKFAWI